MAKESTLQHLSDKFEASISNPYIDADKKYKKTGHKQDTNGTQTEHKQDTNGTQTEHNKNRNRTQLVHKQNTNGTQTEHKQDTNGTQTEHKSSNIDGYIGNKNNLSSIIGLQRKILLFIFNECKINRSKISPPITIDSISSVLEINIKSIKTSVSRMIYKTIISRAESKTGRGGWTKYEIEKSIYSELLISETEHKQDTNGTQTEHKQDTNGTQTEHKQDTEPYTNPSSSGCNDNINNNITTITEKPSDQELPEEWKIMPFHNLNKTIKFGHQQIKNIFNKKSLTADQVEESLAAFANDLEKGLTSFQKAPLSFLMGIMLKGNTYTSVDPKFKTDEEIYMQKQMEVKIAKSNEMRDMQNKAKEASYVIWVSTIGEDERAAILAKLKVFGIDKMNHREKEIHLKSYHEDNIWPDEYTKMRGS